MPKLQVLKYNFGGIDGDDDGRCSDASVTCSQHGMVNYVIRHQLVDLYLSER